MMSKEFSLSESDSKKDFKDTLRSPWENSVCFHLPKSHHWNKKRGQGEHARHTHRSVCRMSASIQDRGFILFLFLLRDDSTNVAKERRNGITHACLVPALKWCLTRNLWGSFLWLPLRWLWMVVTWQKRRTPRTGSDRGLKEWRIWEILLQG